MTRRIIQTDQAPAAIGPYSQAVQVGDLAFISGQIPLDPASMTLVEGDISVQTRQVFDNLRHVCVATGGDLASICKLTIFLTDLGHFATVNDIMAETFAEPYPARAAVGVRELPKGAMVEVEAILSLAEDA
ncbi:MULTISPECIES: RidA family protein [Spiribacter]|jgi:reactive intermediate/imine deaminase|uniref:RidA family protein n=1 Tax=Spiribacter aquaticus TaxID=1935996 RepID=A0A557RN24_9GAMM|nr:MULTISPECIES: RidA family protein [Spiribacter]PZA01025.1 RidA family protein [Gammaproteobacteria bacterium 2W06]AUB77758.1 reactive intermediate/imine deaminase [Spiribacter roseus]KAF0279614.1 reactive intermediate/imine deaminase [Spiribacter roseus]KAF0281327.1 reactive intermediate/imine deaminase [Spiribacter roseus]KAF0283088.1 reactive intermediate/imine deaminase [Spiribacter roseus]